MTKVNNLIDFWLKMSIFAMNIFIFIYTLPCSRMVLKCWFLNIGVVKQPACASERLHGGND